MNENLQKVISFNHFIVIPCFNEATRLPFDDYVYFLLHNKELGLCIVNDGSKDGTLKLIEKLKNLFPNQVNIVNLKSNVGKGNAVQSGVKYILSNFLEFDSIGYLDSDLSVDFDTYKKMLDFHNNQLNIMTYGSRENLPSVHKKNSIIRKIISLIARQSINRLFELPINDTQCGAKIIQKSLAEKVFNDTFQSKWLFDIEIFLRARKLNNLERIQPYFIDKWVFKKNSKMKSLDIFYLIPIDLARILFKKL